MDVFEIGVALAAPEGLREGLAAMAEMLATLDEAAEAGWAQAFEAGRMAAGLGQGAAPRSQQQPASNDVEEGAPGGVEDGGNGVPAAAVRSMPSAAQGGPSRAGGRGEAVSGREQGDRSQGAQKASGLKGHRGVHLTVGRGFGKQGWAAAAPDAATADVGKRGSDGGGRASMRRLAQAAEALAGGSAAGVAPQGGDGDVPDGRGGFAATFDAGPDRGAAPSQGGASVAPKVLVSRVGDVTASQGIRRPESPTEIRRMAAAPSGTGGPDATDVPAQAVEAEQPGEWRGGGLLSAGAAAPAQEEGRAGGGAAPILELDGRVIAQWLGEQMARDASRPAAGTTFFDPRQAPAWSPSGSL